MEKIRILHVLSGLKSGGAETFIMNLYRNINREKIQFDFLIRDSDQNIYSTEIQKLGGNIYIIPKFPKQMIQNIKKLREFFKNNDYKIIHIHANSLIYFFPLIFAKKNNIKKIILHSHNTTSTSKLAIIIHKLVRNIFDSIITDRFSCSENAGKWMFGTKKFKVINNFIEAKKFEYNEENRNKLKKELGLENYFIIGHIGRFVLQKNHEKIISVFKKILEKEKNIKLLLIGEGELKDKIQEKVMSNKLQENVIFMGVRKDIPDLLQVFDLLLFPSLYEGLPFTLVEAQASGVECLISDTITKEVVITDNIKMFSLLKSDDEWAEKIIEIKNSKKERRSRYQEIQDRGFDVFSVVKFFEEFYYK